MNTEKSSIEDALRFFLLIVTIVQFSTWGYQSVIYLLSQAYDVETASTFFDLIIGIIAIASSVSIFTGIALWAYKNVAAEPFIRYGAWGFVAKNAFDIFGDIAQFNVTHATPVAADVISLAQMIGGQITQLGFWVFVLYYFRWRIRRHQEANSAGYTAPSPQAIQ